jgi:uncharacterized damage-inducible protein DinB
MPTSNPVEILLQHDRWATHNILKACTALTHEQFHRRFEMGPGSLHNTTTHIVAVLRFWATVLAGGDFIDMEPDEKMERTPDQLLVLHDERAAEFAAIARQHPLEEQIVRQHEGRTYTYTRGLLVTHVATHNMHHRAQCLNMLRHLGVEPLPQSSVTEWGRAADPNR